MMLKEIITHRRAVFPRLYNDEIILKPEVEKILEAANWAPTHKLTQPWRFKVLMGDKLKEFGHFMADRYQATAHRYSERKHRETRDKFLRSQCVILIGMQRDPKERVPEWEEIASTAMAVQNMWLMATEMGIGSYWSSTSLRKEVGGFIDLEEGESCLGFFYMGRYDVKLPEGIRTPISEKVVWL